LKLRDSSPKLVGGYDRHLRRQIPGSDATAGTEQLIDGAKQGHHHRRQHECAHDQHQKRRHGEAQCQPHDAIARGGDRAVPDTIDMHNPTTTRRPTSC
jgi:hypothetical protein